MKKIIPIILVVVAVGAFFGGMKYRQSKGNNNFGQAFGSANVRGGLRGSVVARGGGGFTTGEILSKDDKSITVKMRDGSSKIIFFSGSTEIGKFITGATNDLAIGKSVMINGSANSDGSISAQSIQIRPPMPQNQKPQNQ